MIKTGMLCAIVFGCTMSAAPIAYVVNGTFQDGGTFSGTFVMDGDNESIVSSQLTTTGPSGTTYTSSGAGVPWVTVDSGYFSVEFQQPTPSFDHLFFFWVAGAPATFTGGPIVTNPPCACTPSREYDFSSGFTFRVVQEGTVDLAPAPEPATWTLLSGALLSTVALRRRTAASRRRT